MKVPKINLYPRGKRGVWWVRYSYHSKTFNYSLKTYLETEAKQMVEDIIYEIRHNLHRPNVTLNELWKRYRDEELIHKRPSSQERDNISIRYLLTEFGSETIDETKLRERVKRYRNKRLKGKLIIPEFSKKKKVCKATVNREIALLKRILNLATYEWNLLRKNPLANFKMFKEGKRHRPITPDEWSKLLSEAIPDLRDFLIIARFTGIRYGIRDHGILGLKWPDVNLNTWKINVRDSKNHTGRNVYMNEVVYKTLKRRKENAITDWVFPGIDGGRRTSFDTAFKGACKRAGINNLRIHDIRHQFGSDKKSEGADLQSLAVLMGHKDIKTTERYGKPNERHLRRIMKSKLIFFDNDCPKTVQNEDDE